MTIPLLTAAVRDRRYRRIVRRRLDAARLIGASRGKEGTTLTVVTR